MAVISWLPTGAAKSEPVVEPIMITVESAVSDTLTVTAVGQEPQTCVTDVNGIGTMYLMPDVEYTFTSSVAKAIDNSGNNYSKNVTLTQSTDAVKVMPDGTLYWYGNESTDITGGWNVYLNMSGQPNILKATNYLYKNVASAQNWSALLTQKNIDFSNWKQLGCYSTWTSGSVNQLAIDILKSRPTGRDSASYDPSMLTRLLRQTTNFASIDISNIASEAITCAINLRADNPNTKVYAIVLFE